LNETELEKVAGGNDEDAYRFSRMMTGHYPCFR